MLSLKSCLRSSVFTLAVATASGIALPAAAQETVTGTAQQENAATPDDGEIIVTAQRQAQNLQDVPVSLSVVSDRDLQTRQINDLSGIAVAAPSLQSGVDRNFAVRGVGTLSFSNTIDNSVAIAIDDVNLGRPVYSSPKLYDIARIEVLNGPQGILFGKNASAGLINIVTKRPEIGTTSGSSDLEVSDRATPGADRRAPAVIAKQTLNLPVTRNSALRLNLLYAYEEPPVTNTVLLDETPIPIFGVRRRNTENNRDVQVKAKYLLEADGGFSLYVIGDYNDLQSGLDRYNETFREFGQGSVSGRIVTGDGITAGPRNLIDDSDGGYFDDLQTGGAQATAAYKLGSGITVSDIFAWRFANQEFNLDADSYSRPVVNTNYAQRKFRQYSNELRVTLPAHNRLSGQAGLFYLSSSVDENTVLLGNNGIPPFLLPNFPFCVVAQPPYGPPPRCPGANAFFIGRSYDSKFDSDSYAAFGQLNFNITDKLEVYAGGRVTHDEVSLDIVQGQVKTFVNTGVLPGTFSNDRGNTNFSYKVGAQYEPSSNLMFYAFYGRGYKGPGYNSFAVADGSGNSKIRPIDPETSNSVEGGFKSTFFDRKLTFNATAFYTKFDDFQVQSFDTNIRTFLVQNAAKVETKGVELTLNARPVRGLSINSSASFLDAEFENFPGAQCYTGEQLASCQMTGTFNAKGLQLPLSPKFKSTVQAIYEVPVAGDVIPFVQGNWNHRSSINFLVNHAPGAELDALDTFGFSGGVRIGDQLRASVFCNNCFNKITPAGIGTDAGDAQNNVLTFTQRFGLDSVRQAGLSLHFDY